MTSPRWPRLVAGLLGFVWFLQIGGGSTLNPTNVGWVLAGDWLQHWLGWLLFRNEPWTFPLGKLADHIKKLPKIIKTAEITDISNRLRALDSMRPKLPLPKGPMPTSAKGARQAVRGR